MSKCVFAARHQCEAAENSARKTKRIMKYALLVFQPQEQFDRFRDSAMAAASKAYGEALRAALGFSGPRWVFGVASKHLTFDCWLLR
jgi:FPC/CPF motif-containing protein YcgG